MKLPQIDGFAIGENVAACCLYDDASVDDAVFFPALHVLRTALREDTSFLVRMLIQ